MKKLFVVLGVFLATAPILASGNRLGSGTGGSSGTSAPAATWPVPGTPAGFLDGTDDTGGSTPVASTSTLVIASMTVAGSVTSTTGFVGDGSKLYNLDVAGKPLTLGATNITPNTFISSAPRAIDSGLIGSAIKIDSVTVFGSITTTGPASVGSVVAGTATFKGQVTVSSLTVVYSSITIGNFTWIWPSTGCSAGQKMGIESNSGGTIVLGCGGDSGGGGAADNMGNMIADRLLNMAALYGIGASTGISVSPAGTLALSSWRGQIDIDANGNGSTDFTIGATSSQVNNKLIVTTGNIITTNGLLWRSTGTKVIFDASGITGSSDNLGNHTLTNDLIGADFSAKGLNEVNASSYTGRGAGYTLMASTQPGQGAGFRTVGSSVNVMGSSIVANLGDTDLPAFSLSNSSAGFSGRVYFQGIEQSTTSSDLIQFTGYDAFGISTNVINVSSAIGFHNRVVLAVDASSPTNNVVMRAFVPPNRNIYRDPICRFFDVSNASTTGALVAYEANSQVITVSIATASANVVPSTMTFSNSQTFTVPGGSAPGAPRRVLDQILTGWAAKIGAGGVDVYLKVTAANPGVNTIIRNFLMESFKTYR